MLQQIGRGPRDTGGGGVVGRLMDCHGRIRRHTAIAMRLAGSELAPGDDVATAAAMCVSYFERALPHHSADEDESIAPRLPAELAAPLSTMAEQHREIHAALDQLIPIWRELAATPAKRPQLRATLEPTTAGLERLFTAHLELEESSIFPAIDALSTEVQSAIIDEMVARRTGPDGQLIG